MLYFIALMLGRFGAWWASIPKLFQLWILLAWFYPISKPSLGGRFYAPTGVYGFIGSLLYGSSRFHPWNKSHSMRPHFGMFAWLLVRYMMLRRSLINRMYTATITGVSHRWVSSNATLTVLYFPKVGLWVGLHWWGMMRVILFGASLALQWAQFYLTRATLNLLVVLLFMIF